MTTTTLTTTTAEDASHLGPHFSSRLDALRIATSREAAAQNLDAMTAVASAISRQTRMLNAGEPRTLLHGTREQQEEARSALTAPGTWQHNVLGWAETATLLHQVSCALRGYTLEVADWHGEFDIPRALDDLAEAWTPAEFAAAFTAVRAELAGDEVHPDALARLTEAAEAITAAPWGPQ